MNCNFLIVLTLELKFSLKRINYDALKWARKCILNCKVFAGKIKTNTIKSRKIGIDFLKSDIFFYRNEFELLNIFDT